MSLLSVLITLLLEHIIGSLEAWRRFDWLAALLSRAEALAKGERSALLLAAVMVAVPAVALGLLHIYLSSIWLGFGFALAVVVLLYSFGPRDLEAEVEAFLEAHKRGDHESAYWYAAQILEEQPPERPRELIRDLMATVFMELHGRLLGVLFWFVLLGPGGALMYRMVTCRAGRAEAPRIAAAMGRLQRLLSWPSARLCAVSFALAGSFIHALHAWRTDSGKWPDGNRGALVSSGFGALQYAPADDAAVDADPAMEADYLAETMALARRAAVIWLSAIALATLAGLN